VTSRQNCGLIINLAGNSGLWGSSLQEFQQKQTMFLLNAKPMKNRTKEGIDNFHYVPRIDGT
jgi:hypothetical protein